VVDSLRDFSVGLLERLPGLDAFRVIVGFVIYLTEERA